MRDTTIWLDHVILAVRDIELAGEHLRREYGLASYPGGRHPAFGTMNRIVPLGTAYLELIAPDPEATPADTRVRDGLQRAIDEGRWLAGWVLAVSDLAQRAQRLGRPVQHGTRTRPDGSVVRWDFVDPGDLLDPGGLPMLIAWGAGVEHPGSVGTAAGAWTLERLVVTVDESRLPEWLGLDDRAVVPAGIQLAANGDDPQVWLRRDQRGIAVAVTLTGHDRAAPAGAK